MTSLSNPNRVPETAPPQPPLDPETGDVPQTLKINRLSPRTRHNIPEDAELKLAPCRRKPLPAIDPVKVLMFVHSHETYTPPGHTDTVTNQPKFDDLCRYGISSTEEADLWHRETTRLIDAVETSRTDKPFRFEISDDTPADTASFLKLSDAADQVIRNLGICIHDNQLVLWGHCREAFNLELYSAAQRHIFRQNDVKSGITRPERSDTDSALEIDQDYVFYCALVDYVTAVMAQNACNAVPNELWQTRVVATLAKSSAKLKSLRGCSQPIVQERLKQGMHEPNMGDANDTIAAISQDTSWDDDASVNPNDDQHYFRKIGKAHIPDNPTVRTLLRDEENTSSVYFNDMSTMSSWALDTLTSVFGEFKATKLSGHSVDAFDVCSVVYGASWLDIPAWVCQDRHGEIAGTSSRKSLRTIYAGFRILQQVADTINTGKDQTTGSQSPGTTGGKPVGARFSLVMHDTARTRMVESKLMANSANLHLHVGTLAEIVSLLIPLFHIQPGPVSNLNKASAFSVGMSPMTSSFDSEPHPSSKFSVYTALRTYAAERQNWHTINLDIGPLSSSKAVADLGKLVWSSADASAQELKRHIRTWEIEDNTVVVMRRAFVMRTIVACCAVVIGGLVAAFSVGNSLQSQGIDPFNFAVYAWVVSAFAILLAKNAYVREWPWRDFLRGRVPCRSASELCYVTGVDEQDVMEYLLSKEPYTILATKGPFNRLFKRRSDDGFSIDIKMNLQTLVASGIIVVTVATQTGPALVCLDARRGAGGRVRHYDGPREEDRPLGYHELPEEADKNEEIPLQTLSKSMKWTRVLGVYRPADKVFR